MIQAEVEYLAGPSPRPIYHASSAGRHAAHEIDEPMRLVTVNVEDARQRPDNDEMDAFGLHASGFSLVSLPTRVDNFLDDAQIKAIYESELEAFLISHTGGRRVMIFDHTVRASDPDVRETKQIREPAYLVHNDYTAKSGFVCLRENLGDEAEELLKRRFQILNIWRPLVDPVENFPLALCDARTLEAGDLIAAERRAPRHIGEIQLAVHANRHRWYYYPKMRPPEVLLFKTFDSINQGMLPCSIHSAIRLPDPPPDARPRESVESRVFVFY